MADLFDVEAPPLPAEATHTCGHHRVYHADCHRCTVLDLAGSPDVVVRATLRRVRDVEGGKAMKALADAVKAARQTL